MVNKYYCCSSYLALRYIEKDDVDFSDNLSHKNSIISAFDNRIGVSNGYELGRELEKVIKSVKNETMGILLSGGMDSACLAAYMRGCNAYTFRFLGGKFAHDELERAEYYAKQYDLKLHYVDISWDDVVEGLPFCYKTNDAPVHSIVPQLYKATKMAMEDGITTLVLGECADNRFGGLDLAFSKDWLFNDFVDFYMYVKPEMALKNPVDMKYVFEPFRKGDYIDAVRFMQTVYAQESETTYVRLFEKMGIKWLFPYENLAVKGGLDLSRIRKGETKYIIRELFKDLYPNIPVPEKLAMPRPVDIYFESWDGPKRSEFKENIPIRTLSGNQKWLLWCLEDFLNLNGI